MRHFLIDTDAASDDAVALVMELQNQEIEVKAITVATGNENALRPYRKLGYIEEWKRMAKKLCRLAVGTKNETTPLAGI